MGAAAPMPSNIPNYYEDFSINYANYEDVIDEQGNPAFKLSFSLHNDGSGYISSFNINTPETVIGFDFDVPQRVIAPGKDYIFEDIVYVKVASFDKEHIISYAYTEFEEKSFSAMTFKEENHYDGYEGYYEYCFNVKGMEYDQTYYNSLIIEYEINGKQYADVDVDFEGIAKACQKEQVNPDDIHVTKVLLGKGDARYNYDDEETIWTLVIALLVSGLFFGIFIVPIFILTKKPWRKAKES